MGLYGNFADDAFHYYCFSLGYTKTNDDTSRMLRAQKVQGLGQGCKLNFGLVPISLVLFVYQAERFFPNYENRRPASP